MKSTKDFAAVYSCGLLKCAIGIINRRVNKPEKNYDPKDPAAAIVQKEAIFTGAEGFLNTKCKEIE